jgi:hypothetical protein
MLNTIDIVDEIYKSLAVHRTDQLELVSPGEKLSFNDDPIALSCASWRLGKEGGGLYHDLDKMTPTSQDRELAQCVRKHYLDQLTMARLKGRATSTFRTKLGAFLVGNHELAKEEVGLLYRLPFFYHEDQCVASVIDQTSPIENNFAMHTRELTLTALLKITQHRRANDRTQFWFSSELNWPVAITVPHSNMLHGLVESLFEHGTIQVQGKATCNPFFGTNRNYIKMTHFRLVSIGV